MSTDRIGGPLKIVSTVQRSRSIPQGINGIVLADGTELVNSTGVLSNFQFGCYEWKKVGFTCSVDISQINYSFIDVPVFIPENFVASEVYVTLKHAPVKYVHEDLIIWGRCENIRLYKNNEEESFFQEEQIFPSEFYSRPKIFENEILGAFGENGLDFQSANAVSYTHLQKYAWRRL